MNKNAVWGAMVLLLADIGRHSNNNASLRHVVGLLSSKNEKPFIHPWRRSHHTFTST